MKVLLIPVAILAFIVFIIVLGAIGLGVAFVVIAVIGKFFSLLGGGARRVSRIGRRQRT